jgi:acyl carrier protein
MFMETYEKIAEIVAAVLRIEPQQVLQLSGDDSLSSIGMDSLNCMDIVVNIEEEFSISFNDEELLLDNLNSINKLTNIVAQKKEQPSLT